MRSRKAIAICVRGDAECTRCRRKLGGEISVEAADKDGFALSRPAVNCDHELVPFDQLYTRQIIEAVARDVEVGLLCWQARTEVVETELSSRECCRDGVGVWLNPSTVRRDNSNSCSIDLSDESNEVSSFHVRLRKIGKR